MATRRNRLPPHIKLGGLLVLLFALWGAFLVNSVRGDRAQLTARVAVLMELQGLRAELVASQPEGARSHRAAAERIAAGLDAPDLQADVAALGATLDAYLDTRSSTTEAALESQLGSLVWALRERNEALSKALGDSWASVVVLVLASLGLAVGLLGLGVVADRRRVRAERLRRDLEEVHLDLGGAKDEANARAARMRQFLSNASQELRTSMLGIHRMLDLLGTTSLNAEQTETVDVIRHSGGVLLTLTGQLVDYSRLRTARIELGHDEFDLLSLVEESLTGVAPSAHSKGIDLGLHYATDVPQRARGDGPRVRQILLNLVGNAVRFTERGGVDVRVALLHSDLGHATYRFEVEDTGPGIELDEQDHLFSAEFGLGLAIARRLVDLMDGEMGVESAPGQGSTFWFTIPLGVPDDGGLRVIRGAPALRGKSVLCADPSEANRAVLEEELSRAGAMVTCLASSDALLEALDAGQEPDVLVVRLEADERDAQLMKAVRERRDGSQLAVIGTAPVGVRIESLVAFDVLGRVPRPLRPTRLGSQVARLLHSGTGPLHEDSSFVGMDLGPSPPIGAEAVLVVDDNAVNRRVTASLLRRAGYEVHVATNGFEAIDAVANRRFALVLMDVRMPDMDGVEATAQIRTLEGEELHTPIVAMTGDVVPGEQRRYLDAGMDDCLAKPVAPELLRSMVGRWVQRASARDGSGAHGPDEG
jgi:two-component system, sensor histidine kinase and response regulator